MAFTGALDLVPLVVEVAAAFAELGAGDGLELTFVLFVPPPWLAEGTDTMIQVEARKIDNTRFLMERGEGRVERICSRRRWRLRLLQVHLVASFAGVGQSYQGRDISDTRKDEESRE